MQDSAPGGPTEPSRGQQRCQGKLTSKNPTWVCSSPPPGCPRFSRPQRTPGLPRGAEQYHPLPVDTRKQASLLGSLQNRDYGALKEKKGATRGLSPTPTTNPPRAAEELCPLYHTRALPKCPALRVAVSMSTNSPGTVREDSWYTCCGLGPTQIGTKRQEKRSF